MNKRISIITVLLTMFGSLALAIPGAGAATWHCSKTATQSDPRNGCVVAPFASGLTNQAAAVTNDAWNWTSALHQQTVNVNGPGNWQSVSSAATGNTAVLSYPDVENTITTPLNRARSVDGLHSFRSAYSIKPPTPNSSADDWEWAWDIWMGSATDNVHNYGQEIMVWTFNHHQRPAGSQTSKTWTDPLTGRAYKVWVDTGDSSGSPLVSFVAVQNHISGSLGIKNMYNWLKANGLTRMTGVNQVGYGPEICSTSGRAESFTVTGYSLAAT